MAPVESTVRWTDAWEEEIRHPVLMLPPGHIASGALLGIWYGRGGRRRLALTIAGGVAATVLPDLDVLIPRALDRLRIRHELHSGVHHRWFTHTPLFWGSIALSARRAARGPGAADWARQATDLLAFGAAIHITEDAIANTVALLWPLRRREYGLGLDRMPDVTNHTEYIRRYPRSPAGWLEGALVAAAAVSCWRRVSRFATGGTALASGLEQL
jgi:membrane-bound metal-dependent hydrolase YbcI (DUF457 family)